MAFTNFYLIAGGTGSSDINAGSTIGAAQATTTNGNWNAATGVFIAASGTPFASTIVGDYASVYNDGATVTGFVGKVTTVTSSTQITVDVTTIKYGQNIPTTSATGRSCTINGSWNSEIVLAATGLATFTVPQSTKINIKGNLTITASRNISMAGVTTTPLWFSGYNTNPGDLDNDTTNSLAKPIWTFTNSNTGLTTSGAHHLWSSLSVVANTSGSTWTCSSTTNFAMIRCRSENTSSGVSAHALSPANNCRYSYSWFKCNTSALSPVSNSSAGDIEYVGCIVDGGGTAGFDCGSVDNIALINCICINGTGVGVRFSTGIGKISGLTVYGAYTDGIKWTGTPAVGGTSITGCLFSGLNNSTAMTNGINNGSGTNSNNIFRACNDYYNVTNTEVGFGDSPSFFGQTDSNPVVTSGSNMTPSSGTNAINNGFPGIFENESFNSYPAIGAVQPLASGGSAVAIFGS